MHKVLTPIEAVFGELLDSKMTKAGVWSGNWLVAPWSSGASNRCGVAVWEFLGGVLDWLLWDELFLADSFGDIWDMGEVAFWTPVSSPGLSPPVD